MFLFSILSLEEALLCIPPPIMYSPKCTTLKATTRANGDLPTKFNQNKVVFCKENVCVAINSNICMILNWLMVPGYNFSRHQIYTSGVPDFNCYLLELLILVFEVKRKHVLENIDDQIFPEFYWANKKARTVIQQIYNYMGVNELKYGILTTYDESPSVFKIYYAYLAQKANENLHSTHPLVLVPAHRNTGSRVL
ncbi:hypothetical protein RhiirB3_453914 [Rhizophagus irregularis]|nr:hypothetical protein RhiirB3_453914 [Rhizophagus irregularis]